MRWHRGGNHTCCGSSEPDGNGCCRCHCGGEQGRCGLSGRESDGCVVVVEVYVAVEDRMVVIAKVVAIVVVSAAVIDVMVV